MEIGEQYGALTIIEIINRRKDGGSCLCKCLCGNTKIVKFSHLKNNQITSCGCRINIRLKNIQNLSGQTFGFLKVIEIDNEKYDFKNKKIVYKCQCLNCGSICYKKGGELKAGKIKSCGCLANKLKAQSHFIEEVGKQYGDLIVIGSEFDPKDNILKNKCKCSCGNICLVSGSYLRSGNTKSCGCKKGWFSYEVQEIENFLKENNILYKKEYSFPDLLGDKSPLRFDFAIFKKDKLSFCIEYNGKQHYQSIDYFGGEEGFKNRIKYDNLKIDYCKRNNIPLVILKYNNSHEENLKIINNFLEKENF